VHGVARAAKGERPYFCNAVKAAAYQFSSALVSETARGEI
jgi:hypothetical protein